MTEVRQAQEERIGSCLASAVDDLFGRNWGLIGLEVPIKFLKIR